VKMDSLSIKLASIVVHVEELLSPDGREADKNAILGLLADHEVRAFLEDPANRVYLPLMRRSKTRWRTP
jgi:hypothetical protein